MAKEKGIKLNEPVMLTHDPDFATYAYRLDDDRVVEYVRDGDLFYINHANLKSNDVLVFPKLNIKNKADNQVSFIKSIDIKNKNLTFAIPENSVGYIYKYTAKEGTPVVLDNVIKLVLARNYSMYGVLVPVEDGEFLPIKHLGKEASETILKELETGYANEYISEFVQHIKLMEDSEYNMLSNEQKSQLVKLNSVYFGSNVILQDTGHYFANGKIEKKKALSDVLEEKGFN